MTTKLQAFADDDRASFAATDLQARGEFGPVWAHRGEGFGLGGGGPIYELSASTLSIMRQSDFSGATCLGIGGDRNHIWKLGSGAPPRAQRLAVFDFSVIFQVEVNMFTPSGMGGDGERVWHYGVQSPDVFPVIAELSPADLSLVQLFDISSVNFGSTIDGVGGDQNTVWIMSQSKVMILDPHDGMSIVRQSSSLFSNFDWRDDIGGNNHHAFASTFTDSQQAFVSEVDADNLTIINQILLFPVFVNALVGIGGK